MEKGKTARLSKALRTSLALVGVVMFASAWTGTRSALDRTTASPKRGRKEFSPLRRASLRLNLGREGLVTLKFVLLIASVKVCSQPLTVVVFEVVSGNFGEKLLTIIEEIRDIYTM